MSALRPAYLIWGDDEVRIDAWRARLRARAQEEAPSATLEVLKDDRLSSDSFAQAAGALTLSVGRRYLLADGVEGWKEADAKQAAAALASLPADTVAVLIAAGKAPALLAKAVEAAGGHFCEAPRPAGYPRWIAERARDIGLEIEREGAQSLLERVGRNQRRLLRELEKLSVYAGPGGRVGSDEVDALSSSAVEARAFELADAVIEGDAARALDVSEELRDRGEDLMHILFALLRRLHDCKRVLTVLTAGGSLKDVQSELRVPAFVAKKLVAQAKRADPDRLGQALELLADLDYAIRGVGDRDADSALTITLARAAGARDALAA